MTKPLVSVIVPSYNHENYITQCIESIMNQSYKNFELFVIDDGSTDSSREILQKLQKLYGFELIFQKNRGISKTFNFALKELCKGEYFTFCASDDYWDEHKLKKQVEFLELNRDIPICYGKCYIIDKDSKYLEKKTKRFNKKLKGGYIFKDIIEINFHPPVNYMIRKEIYNIVGYYNDEIYTEDFYMNLKISRNFPFGFINDYLSFYRLVNSKEKIISLKMYYSHLKCINEYKDSEYYVSAIKKWNYNIFMRTSPYIIHKLLAIKSFFKSGKYLFKGQTIKGLIKLTLTWR